MWEEEWVQRYLPNWIIGCSRPAIQITTHRLYWIIVSNVLHKRFSSIRVVRVSLIIFALFLIGHSVDLFYTIKLFLFFPLFFFIVAQNHKYTNWIYRLFVTKIVCWNAVYDCFTKQKNFFFRYYFEKTIRCLWNRTKNEDNIQIKIGITKLPQTFLYQLAGQMKEEKNLFL